jgi:hypothetical protein
MTAADSPEAPGRCTHCPGTGNQPISPSEPARSTSSSDKSCHSAANVGRVLPDTVLAHWLRVCKLLWDGMLSRWFGMILVAFFTSLACLRRAGLLGLKGRGLTR